MIQLPPDETEILRCPQNRTNFANERSIFDFYAENAKIADCLAERAAGRNE
jgi:hypothetical protein